MPDVLENSTTFNRNSLPNRQCKAARKILVRRTVYEGDALSDIAVARRAVRKAIKKLNANQEPDVTVFALWCRELDRLLERERILLRIPLPTAQPAKSISRQPAPIVELDSPSPELQAKLDQASAGQS